MSINVFKLEDYLAKHEFSAPYLLCCSDAESVSMQEIIGMANSQELSLWQGMRLGYTEPKGLSLLRMQIAASLYPELTADNILCFAGAEDGIFCALHTLCEEGDHVIAFTPCYQSLLEVPVLKGAFVTKLALREDNDWRIDLKEIESAIQPNTKCIIINFPHNPTGQVLTAGELDALVQICDKHGIWLFADEVYRLLGAPKDGWAPNVAEVYNKGLSLGVMSKAFGMAGLRVGWIACQDRQMLEKIESMKHYTSICNSGPSEVLSLIALRNKDAILDRNNSIVAENLKLLDAFLEEYAHLFKWVRPQGGCIGFVKYMAAESVDKFADRLVNEKGVLLMPASIYDQPSNHFRVGFGRINMAEGLDKLREFLQL